MKISYLLVSIGLLGIILSLAPQRAYSQGSDDITVLRWSPDGEMIAAYRPPSGVCLYDGNNFEVLPSSPLSLPDTSSPYVISFGQDSRTLITGHTDGTIQFWDTATGDLVEVLKNGEAEVQTIVLSPNGRWLAAGARGDEPLRIWDVKTHSLWQEIDDPLWLEIDPSIGVYYMVFSPDSRQLAYRGGYRAVFLWDSEDNVSSAIVDGNDGVFVFSPKGNFLINITPTTMGTWNLATGDYFDFERYQEYHGIYNNKTGNLIAIKTDLFISIYEPLMSEGQLNLNFKGIVRISEFYIKAAFHPNKPLMAYGYQDVHIYDIEAKREIAQLADCFSVANSE